MTEEKVTTIINTNYGYEIINEKAKQELIDIKKKVLSELGIETLYEFLSYDINEFSDMRKTIQARRFFQTYKDTFSLDVFDMEAFHKIQAACLFIVTVSGNRRGYKDYMYTGFVQNIFKDMGYYSKENIENSSIRQKLMATENVLRSFNEISVGIYSIQVYTRHSMAIDKIMKFPIEHASKLFLDIIDDFQKNKNPATKIKKLISMIEIKRENAEKTIAEYIDHAINDLSQSNMLSEDKDNDETIDNNKYTKQNARDYLSRYIEDIERIMDLSTEVIDKLHILEENPDNYYIEILYMTLIRELTQAYERLLYYEDTSFVRSLNNIFVANARRVIEQRAKREIDSVRNECINIIEKNISEFSVFELDGVIAGLSGEKYKFDHFYKVDPKESQATLEQLDDFLTTTFETITTLKNEMRDRIKIIINLEIMTENEKTILKDLIYDFDTIIKFIMEDEQ